MKTIDLTNDGEQNFTVELEEVIYRFRVYFNDRSSSWSLDIADEEDNDIVHGLRCVLGQNILEGLNLDLGAIVVHDTTGTGVEAGIDSFQDGTHLMISFTQEEVDSASV